MLGNSILLSELQFKVRDAKRASKEMRTLARAKRACCDDLSTGPRGRSARCPDCAG